MLSPSSLNGAPQEESVNDCRESVMKFSIRLELALLAGPYSGSDENPI